MIEESGTLCQYNGVTALNGGKASVPIFRKKQKLGKGNILYISKGKTSLSLKNGSVPQDMLVLSVMTLSADLLRQIATDPPWIFQGTLDWKWSIQFPTGNLAISSLCITEKASTFGFGWSHKNIQFNQYSKNSPVPIIL